MTILFPEQLQHIPIWKITQSLGKNIKWDEKPYADLNRIFKEYRETAERLAVNKASAQRAGGSFSLRVISWKRLMPLRKKKD
ncbi:MAG: hypothetical protein MZV70_54855 [Desulfobacterales bacterium]|nr:hypothetical protein [Desulfobacterales bacterium]